MGCDQDQPDDLRTSVIERFDQTATAPDQECRLPVGPGSAKGLGYDPNTVDGLPASVTESFCGIGNPFWLDEPRSGQTVLDLGCGAGFDTLLAARSVGSLGQAIGVGMMPRMIAKACSNAAALGLENIEFLLAAIERLPLPDASVDLVIFSCWHASSKQTTPSRPRTGRRCIR
jgi:SAM-dependent methyltransferase